jgi:hypothetical protein
MFGQPTPYSVGLLDPRNVPFPFAVAVGEFNGDGHPDLVVVNNIENNVSVLLNKGDGTFEQPAVNFDVGPFPDSVVVADLAGHGDGRQDIVVANQSGVWVLLNITLKNALTPRFAAAKQFSFPGTRAFRSSVVVGDFDGDGKPGDDLAVVNSDGSVSVLLNRTTPLGSNNPNDLAFQSRNLPRTLFQAVGGAVSLAVGNFDGQGPDDIAVGGSRGVAVLVGQGNGEFNLSNNPFPRGASTTTFVAAGNFSSTSHPDIAVANFPDQGQLSVVGLDLSGQLKVLPTFAGEGISGANAVSDVNGDGNADIVSLETVGVRVTLGPFLGGKLSEFDFSTRFFPEALAVGDFNGDGLPDLAVVGGEDGNPGLLVLLNETGITTTPPSPPPQPPPSNSGGTTEQNSAGMTAPDSAATTAPGSGETTAGTSNLGGTTTPPNSGETTLPLNSGGTQTTIVFGNAASPSPTATNSLAGLADVAIALGFVVATPSSSAAAGVLQRVTTSGAGTVAFDTLGTVGTTQETAPFLPPLEDEEVGGPIPIRNPEEGLVAVYPPPEPTEGRAFVPDVVLFKPLTTRLLEITGTADEPGALTRRVRSDNPAGDEDLSLLLFQVEGKTLLISSSLTQADDSVATLEAALRRHSVAPTPVVQRSPTKPGPVPVVAAPVKAEEQQAQLPSGADTQTPADNLGPGSMWWKGGLAAVLVLSLVGPTVAWRWWRGRRKPLVTAGP